MTTTITTTIFTTELFDLLTETFERVGGMYLDRGTSLFETLATISAAEASIPVGGQCATLAAQVEHVRFYLDVLEQVLTGHEIGKVDWGEIWRTVGAVTPAEWQASQERLVATYQRVRTTMEGIENWDHDWAVSAALSIVVHTAYHLGEIRQALCIVKSA